MKPQLICTNRKTTARTNEEGTCLYCGRKLRRASGTIRKAWVLPKETFGDYADNAFCGRRCGYEFGVNAAILGFRLMPRKG